MKKTVLSWLLFLIFAGNLLAQTSSDSVAVYTKVVDSFTYEMLKGVRVEILRPDSSLITEFQTGQEFGYGGYIHNVSRPLGQDLNVPRSGCIFRYSKEGYITQCVSLKAGFAGRRQYRVRLGEVLLKKKRNLREQELGEAIVTASKIRMVVKGDTIVYNADAFQLAQGSMLDGLIKRLPGFELQGGQIRINGQYVSSLLVNGEEFFKGDPRVALENLPAYMVDKVKVYRKENAYSYITKERSKDDLPLVVDVNLKRQYAIGWVANAGVGYGLEDRYMARLFTLRFTNNSRLAIYGNANNTNDTREPGTSGNWNAQGVARGRMEMQTGGFEALVKDKEGVWKYTGNAKVFHQETDDRSITSAETFQPGLSGSTFSRLRNQTEGRNFKVQTAHQYEYKKPVGYMTLSGDAYYQRNRSRADAFGAELAADPEDSYRGAALDSLFFHSSDRLTAMLINSRLNRQKDRAETWRGNIGLTSLVSIPRTPDYLNINAGVSVEKRNATSFSDYLLHYGRGMGAVPADDHRQRYSTTPVLASTAQLNVSYAYRPDWAHIKPYYEMDNSFRDADRSFFRLDWLGADALEFGQLPSTTAALMSCLDAPNSYTSRLNMLVQKAGVSWTIWLPGNLPSHNIILEPEVQWRTDRLTYHRDRIDARPRRNEVAFTPYVKWGFDNCIVSYKLNYSYPGLISLLDYTDNADPLNLFKGNPNLKRSTHHNVKASRSFSNWQEGWYLYLKADWQMTRNAIANAMDYDERTGVRTFSPRNVDGNWRADMSVDYKKPLDKKKQTILSTITGVNYRNSVDYVTERSSVRNLSASENLRLNTRIKSCVLDFSAGVKYLHATSRQSVFSDINSFDFKYSAATQIPLPANFSLSVDATLYHRTGYTDESLNDVRFVANARLGKTFLEGRLDLTLDAFDIFHGLSNVTKYINAQGLTETWYNSLPSYAMLHVSYKFSKKPRKP